MSQQISLKPSIVLPIFKKHLGNLRKVSIVLKQVATGIIAVQSSNLNLMTTLFESDTSLKEEISFEITDPVKFFSEESLNLTLTDNGNVIILTDGIVTIYFSKSYDTFLERNTKFTNTIALTIFKGALALDRALTENSKILSIDVPPVFLGKEGHLITNYSNLIAVNKFEYTLSEDVILSHQTLVQICNVFQKENLSYSIVNNELYLADDSTTLVMSILKQHLGILGDIYGLLNKQPEIDKPLKLVKEPFLLDISKYFKNNTVTFSILQNGSSNIRVGTMFEYGKADDIVLQSIMSTGQFNSMLKLFGTSTLQYKYDGRLLWMSLRNKTLILQCRILSEI